MYSQIHDFGYSFLSFKAWTYKTIKITEYSNFLFNQGQTETAKRLEVHFQSQKKESKLRALTEKTSGLKKEKILYIGLGAIGLIGAFFMFRYAIKREKKLNTEKRNAEMQAKLKEEEQARLKAEQELMALQQQKLQNEEFGKPTSNTAQK